MRGHGMDARDAIVVRACRLLRYPVGLLRLVRLRGHHVGQVGADRLRTIGPVDLPRDLAMHDRRAAIWRRRDHDERVRGIRGIEERGHRERLVGEDLDVVRATHDILDLAAAGEQRAVGVESTRDNVFALGPRDAIEVAGHAVCVMDLLGDERGRERVRVDIAELDLRAVDRVGLVDRDHRPGDRDAVGHVDHERQIVAAPTESDHEQHRQPHRRRPYQVRLRA